jgi:two-component system cell cycle response regulator DivK
VHIAGGGAEAVEVARRVRPQIVLMDLEMPDVTGFEATRRLKSDSELESVIVVAVTAHAMKREADAAIKAGCAAVICKPYDLLVLADALPRLLTQGVSALDVAGLTPNPTRRQ